MEGTVKLTGTEVRCRDQRRGVLELGGADGIRLLTLIARIYELVAPRQQ